MPELLSNRPHQELLSNRPHVEKLWEFVDRVLKQKGDEIEFSVLYGSMAKGNWSVGSDYDMLIWTVY